MSDNKEPIDKPEAKADRITEQRTAYRADTGIGGGLAGAAIGGLIGDRVGGVVGAVLGAVAGALVGRGTAQRVNRTVDSLVDAANTVAGAVNYGVNTVGNAVKDTVEEVRPSVIGVVDAVKDTVEEVKPSNNHNSKLDEERLVGVQLRRSSQDHPLSKDVKQQTRQRIKPLQEPNNIKEIDRKLIEYKNIQQRQEEYKRNRQETTQELKQQRLQLPNKKIKKVAGIIVGAATITLMGVTLAFSPKQNLLETKSPQSNLGIKSPQLATKSQHQIQELNPHNLI
jgi:uncharacterized protein YcfJ